MKGATALMKTETGLKRRYQLELFASALAYAVLLISVNVIADRVGTANKPLLIVLSLVPMIPVAFIVAAVTRYLLGCDELERHIQLTSLAVTMGATAFVTFSYGFLEGAGFPRLSMFSVWPLMASVWLITSLIMRFRYR